MSNLLKLDFNERGDKLSPVAVESGYSDLWRYPERENLESIIAGIESLQTNQVFCTNGGDEAIMILMRLIKETSKLILPLPAFSQYTWGVESWKLDATLVPANDDLTIDLASTKNAVAKTSNSIVVITRPNNPTGEKIQLNSLLDLIETASTNGSKVFLDEAYIEFSDDIIAASELVEQFDNLLILRTLSKAYGLAGIRLGYLLGDEKLISEFKTRSMPFNIPQPSLEIAERALLEDNQKEMLDYCEVIKKNRTELSSWLAKSGIETVESEANFVLFRVSVLQAEAIKSFLNKRDILVRTFERGDLAGCVRVTIPYTLEILMPLLKQVLTPELVCFDMDGVLIDTSESYDLAVKATVEKLGNKAIDVSEVFSFRDSGGFNNDWVLSQALLEQQGIKLTLEEVTEVFQSFYLGENNDGLVANEKKLINASLTSIVNSKEEVQFSIVTGRPRPEAEAGAKLIEFSAAPIISLDDVEQPKPSPEGVKKLQCQFSKNSWMCGDNPDDMQAANGSNSLAIGIGKRNAEALYLAGADVVLESINQLEDWLKPAKRND